MFLEFQQVWCHKHFPGEPVLVSNHTLSEKTTPNIQLEPPLMQLHVIPSGSITVHQRADSSAGPSAPPPWETL